MSRPPQTIEEHMAEDATGCNANPHGLGQFFTGPINRNGFVTNGGDEINDVSEMRSYLAEGGSIAVPNAGAGSYSRVFEILGFKDIDVFEWTSSAGDWTFVVFDGAYWIPAWQSNRYPYPGFEYSVDVRFPACRNKEEIMEYLTEGN